MKTVSAGFAVAQEKVNPKPIYRIYFKRRYWNAGTSAYIWETDWTEIDQSEIVGVDAIVHSLDNVTFNQFLVSNTVIKFVNDKMQWKEGSHTDSKFKADGVSSFGYVPYLTKFKVKAGFEDIGEKDIRQGNKVLYSDYGSEELVSLFTGLGVEYWTDSDQRIAYIRAIGFEEILYNGDATNVANSVSLETIGTGDGVTTEFKTARCGVANISAVTVNSVTMTKGIDYTVSDLNSIDDPAVITLALPASSSHLVKCTYTYWKVNQTVESLITDLLTEAGITTYSVDNATLGSIVNNFTKTARGEFEGGTNTSIDTSAEPGTMLVDLTDSANSALLDDFSSSDLTTKGWSAYTTGADDVYDQVSGALKQNATPSGSSVSGTGLKRTIPSAIFGQWKFDLKADAGASFVDVKLNNLSGGSGFGSIVYEVALYPTLLYFNIYNGTDPVIINVATVSGLTTSFKTVTVRKYQNGTIRVYLDGTLVIKTEDANLNPIDTIVFGFGAASAGITQGMYIDNIYTPANSITATHQSETIDTVGGLSAWGNLGVTIEGDVTDFTFKTRTSTDGATWDSWVAVGSGNSIESAVKRYIQVQIILTISNDALYDPVHTIFDYTVQFTSNRVFVSLADFTGMNCQQAISELAKLSNYEWGFDDDETFFFRSRDVSATPDATFSGGSNLLEINALLNGYDRAYSIFRAEFGQFRAEQSATDGVRTSALEIFGKKIYTVTSQILINKATNLADAIATAYKTRLQSVKRRARILTKFWPQIELSDTASVTYRHDAYNLDLEPYLQGFVGKVIYTRHDPMNAVSEFEVEEI